MRNPRRERLLAVPVFLVAFATLAAHARAETPSVIVTIIPQANFVERITNGAIRSVVLIEPGQSHHTFEMTPRKMTELSRGVAFLRIGLPFEERLAEKLLAQRPDLPVVNTAATCRVRYMSHSCEHEGDDHAHHHGETPDPHVWLDPTQAVLIVKEMLPALVRITPDRAAEFEGRAAEFIRELEELHARIRTRLEPFKGRSFLVFHPAYGYFADAYGLTEISVEVDGKEPTARQLTEILDVARKAGIRNVLIQPQFPRRSAEAVASALGGKCFVADPMGKDYIANLEAVAKAVEASMQTP